MAEAVVLVSPLWIDHWIRRMHHLHSNSALQIISSCSPRAVGASFAVHKPGVLIRPYLLFMGRNIAEPSALSAEQHPELQTPPTAASLSAQLALGRGQVAHSVLSLSNPIVVFLQKSAEEMQCSAVQCGAAPAQLTAVRSQR
jgi:hypothetical protein